MKISVKYFAPANIKNWYSGTTNAILSKILLQTKDLGQLYSQNTCSFEQICRTWVNISPTRLRLLAKKVYVCIWV